LIIWFMTFLIGIYVAMIAVAVTLCIRHLTRLKLDAVKARILFSSVTRCPAAELESAEQSATLAHSTLSLKLKSKTYTVA